MTKKKKDKKWIKGAIKHPGSLTKEAKKHGESPMEFAREHKNAPGKTGKRARLALTLGKMHHKGRKKTSRREGRRA